MKCKQLFKGLITIAMGAMVFTSFGPAATQAHAAKVNVSHASAAAVMNVNKSKVAWSKKGNTLRPIASISKLMTLYLVRQKLDDTSATWNSKVNTSYHGLKTMGKSSVYGGFKFNKNSYTVRQLYLAALIESSNNAAIALGQWVAGGSTPSANKKFIKMMNTQAKKWNFTRAKFVSANGMENNELAKYGYGVSGSYANLMSANYVAHMATNLINEYPDITEDSSIKSMKIDGQTLYNYNNLLPGRKYYQASLNVDGLKTGYTTPAGYCFVGTAKKSGHDRIVSVVLNDVNEFTETRSLMNYAYSKGWA
ncbi:serine hydrolase [Lentilactobacillus sp. Marseille-Q4993]|uniref:D-alanyl-D-alanine carboxypeptidase family protein n=1 Tax=Lentilactobacillus sp. Marseille-Q4993 TaxID=3039492 RepID=UPI0024BC9D11|nr:serine hydrolase [Lentilactobacillus sp. Marseille-Q4993]